MGLHQLGRVLERDQGHPVLRPWLVGIDKFAREGDGRAFIIGRSVAYLAVPDNVGSRSVGEVLDMVAQIRQIIVGGRFEPVEYLIECGGVEILGFKNVYPLGPIGSLIRTVGVRRGNRVAFSCVKGNENQRNEYPDD